MGRIELSPVDHSAHELLYDLLKERPPEANISHIEMPTWEQHVAFVESMPYAVWYVIQLRISGDVTPIGSIYLTKQDEIGLFLFKGYQGHGYGKEALKMLMAANPRKRFIANIAPGNDPSQKLFVSRGFKHIQNTYELMRPA